MKAQNPMRISHESLDLDDIISDLNDTQSQQAAYPVGSQKVQEESKSKKPGAQSKITKQPSRAKLSNKENKPNNLIAAKSNGLKEVQNSEAKKDFLVSTTDEDSRAAQVSTTTEQAHSNRYNDSNFKFESSNHNESQMPSQQTYEMAQPFYIGRSQPSAITDEDVESFQKRLDTLIVNFRSETLQEFLKTKKTVLQDQHSQIENERRRCNTLLGVKSNEIEQLKEQLGKKTKLSEELQLRSEILALWAGKGKTLARMKVLQLKAFTALQDYCKFKKHSKTVLKNRLVRFKEDQKRKVFRGWEKQYKQWKIEKNKTDFEKAVKSELQHICAQYNKEIESLREKLNEAQSIVDQENRNKQMMQENLKKAFMRGVCALNFEAMNILNPADVGYQTQVEREMEKQVLLAMNGITSQNPQQQQFQNTLNPFSQPTLALQEPNQTRSPTHSNVFQSFNQAPKFTQAYGQNDMSYSDSQYSSERKFMTIGENDTDYKKIDSKDSMWKPAPIMGREINSQPQVAAYSQPTITSNLRTAQQHQNYVLPSHFQRAAEQMQQTQEEPRFERLEATTEDRTVQFQSQVSNSSVLPDLVSNLPQVTNGGQSSQGKTIYASGELKSTKAQSSTTNRKVMNGSTATSQKKK